MSNAFCAGVSNARVPPETNTQNANLLQDMPDHNFSRNAINLQKNDCAAGFIDHDQFE